MPRKKTVNLIAYRAPLETSHVPRLPICCDAVKTLSPRVGLEALPLARATPPAHSKWQVFQNQKCIRLGLGRFSEVPLDEHNAADSWGQ